MDLRQASGPYSYANDMNPLKYYYVLDYDRGNGGSGGVRQYGRPNWNVHRNHYYNNSSGIGDNELTSICRVDDIYDDYVGPTVTSFGVMCLFLRHKMRVDITLDRAVRLVNGICNCSAAIDASGTCSTIVHPSGKMYQTGIEVELHTFNWRHAKIGRRGITFATRGSPIVFLVDEGGVKTSVDKYQVLACDLSIDVFYEQSRHGQSAINECLEQMRKIRHYYDGATKEHSWMVNGVRVTQAEDGDVLVSREQGRRTLKSSFTRGNISVKTPLIYACASLPPEAHVFVRRGERRIHCSERDFVVRNGPRSAGLDECGKLKIY